MTWATRTDSFTDLLAVKDRDFDEVLPKKLSPATLSLLYDNHWLVQRICNLPVDLGLKDGFHTSPASDPATSESPGVSENGTIPPKDSEAFPATKKPATKTDAAPVVVAAKVPMATGSAAKSPSQVEGQGQVDPNQAPQQDPKADLEADEGYQVFLKWNRTEYAPDGIVHKTAKLGRLQGGHCVVVGTEAAPELEYAGEAVVWIDEVSRSEICVKEWEEDKNSPRYRQPKIFEITAGHARGPLELHFSKVIIFPGLTVASRVPWQERHWTNSVLQPILRALCGYDNALEGIVNALARFDVGVLKSAGLFAALDLLNKEEIDARKQVFNDGIRNSRTIFLDPEKQEDYERLPLDLSGLPEAMQLLKDDLAGATALPQTQLFGINPESGVGGGGGESQDKIVNDAVEAYKENVLRPALEKLMSMLMQAPTKVTFEKPKAANDGSPGGENSKEGDPTGVGSKLGNGPTDNGLRSEGAKAG